jgi:hypothetical protein
MRLADAFMQAKTKAATKYAVKVLSECQNKQVEIIILKAH